MSAVEQCAEGSPAADTPSRNAAGPANLSFARLLRDIARLPGEVLAASICMNVSSLLLPLVVMQVYDRVIPNQSGSTLLALASLAVLVFVIEAVLRSARAHVVFWSATRTAWLKQDDAVARVLAAPGHWWAKESPSRVVDRLRSVAAVCEWQASPSRLVLLDLPFVLLFLGLMALVAGPLALVPALVFAAMGAVVARHGLALRRAGETSALSEMRLHDFLSECLSSILTIKGNALEEQMRRRHERLQNTAAHATATHIRLAEETRSFADLLAGATQIVTMTAGAAAVVAGYMSIGTLACCTLLAGRAVQPLLRCIAMWSEIQGLAVDIARAEPILSLPPPGHRPCQKPCCDEAGGPLAVRLAAVTTVATPDFEDTLDSADLWLPAGGIGAIIGNRGPGASPVIGILTGRLPIIEGRIEIDGIQMQAEDLQAARRIRYVSALHRPIDGTLLDNLTGFQRGRAVEAARDAARLIGLEEDIDLLSAGYATRVGLTASSDVPEGVLRRAAIARAIASEPGLLVLDCANEGLDTPAELRLMEGLSRLRGRMSILILTNRPSFAAAADHVVRYDAGFFRDVGRGPGGHRP